MPLVLRVLSAPNRTAAFEGTKTFEFDGTIGRTPDNDWVLPDQQRIVSSHHAEISGEGGRYFIADRSTNGIAVNGREMQKGGTIELRSGDHLTIGNYQIAVSVENSAARAPAVPAYASSPAPDNSFDDIFAAPSPFGVGAGGGDPMLDPLVALGGGDKPRQKPPPPRTMDDHVSAESVFFEPPRVITPPPAAPRRPGEISPLPAAPRRSGEIPENWDETGFATVDTPALPSAPPRAPPGPPPEPPRPRNAAPAPPPDWAADDSEAPPPPPSRPRNAAPAPPQNWAEDDNVSPAPMPPARPAATGSGTSALDLASVLRAAGIDPAKVDPALAASLGEVLRVVVEGLMAVLKARAEIKNQFRVAMTTLKPLDNNPLKFSVDANDALANLFGKRTATYQSPGNAFKDAFEDLKAHQMAMMAGMRAAFTELMTRFDPEKLQETFDRGLKRSAILGVMNKTKYWDLYRDMYESLGDDDATFRRLFGDEFAQAYEEQMQRLAALRGKR